MKLRNDTRHLKFKAISSMRSAMTAFNSPDDDGRVTRVLLHLQHAFEMLLKAALVQDKRPVFDKNTGRSVGFEKCINYATEKPISLTNEEAGTLRAIDAMRDDEQHWYVVIDESLLYLYTRAGVTLFDDLLHRVFAERLAGHLPVRVLPVGTEPPQDFQTLVDREYHNIADLLKPGRRARAEADARVRALLAMESQVNSEAAVSNADVQRVVKGIQAGKTRAAVFPSLSEVATAVDGAGTTVEVRFVKKEGLPVQLVKEDEGTTDAAAIRLVPLQRKFHWGAFDLADKVGLSRPRATALRQHLGIDNDPDCCYTFTFGSQRHPRYSDNAYTRMRNAIKDGIEMDAIWASHASGRLKGPRPVCTQSGCKQHESVAS
ncbi:DUF3644 domain-containing protein [Rhodococcus sp. X156]|uniref:DUF3644 domain-containing protein n=1 Tax=Rhodococcus sp. X156 TaxID=2499145 RepID=UPI001F495CFD|nr:DUF3644 domain-containing protein [Rhodococcus sp. X156]